MKTILAVLSFITLYIAADYIGSILPWWVGLGIVLAGLAFLISLIVKLGKVSR